MGRYVYSFTGLASGTAPTALAWLRTTAGKDARVWEVGLFQTGGTATTHTVGLGRPAAVSLTPSTNAVPQAEDTSLAAAVITGQIAASTKPTAPTNFLRQIGLPATLGAGIIWTFPMGLVIPSGPAELVLWEGAQGGTAATFSGYLVYDE